MTLQVRFDGKTIEERQVTIEEANLHLNIGNFKVGETLYVIDDSTFDREEQLVQLIVHEF